MNERKPNPAVARLRRRAAARIWADRLAGAAALPCLLLLAYLVLALFGLGQPVLGAMAALAALVVLGIGLARLRRPAAAEIDNYVEQAAGLRHRPLAALEDEPAIGDPAAMALWQLHQRRAAAALANARLRGVARQAALRDPLALRSLPLLLLLVAGVVAGPAAPGRLTGAFAWPSWPFAGPGIDAWITPPGYAAAPPQLLVPGEHVTALAGSTLTVIVNGPRRVPRIRLVGATFTAASLASNSFRADAVINHSGRLLIGPWWHRLAGWTIDITPPAAPVVQIRGLTLDPGGKLTVHWQVDDPYGLTALTLDVPVPHHPRALRLRYALPLATGAGAGSFDLLESPYHNLPVGLRLSARNLAGLVTTKDFGNGLVLPGMTLHDKTALALDHARQMLALVPDSPAAAAGTLHTIAAGPPSAITPAVDVQISGLAGALAYGQSDATAAVDQMLDLIKQIEGGPAYAAAQALAGANQMLLQALQRGLNGQAPNAAALRQMLQAMHDALARRLAAQQPPAGQDTAGRSFDPAALDRLAQQIAQDEAAGLKSKTEQEMRQLQAAMNALANARPMTPAEQARAKLADTAAQALSTLTTGEAALLDNTQRGTGTAADQNGLQAALAAIQQSLQKAGLNLPGLGQAGQAMQTARGALAGQQDDAAANAETQAIQGLQQAAAALNAARQNDLAIGHGNAPLPGQQPQDNGVNGGMDETFIPGLDTPAANPAAAIQQRIIRQDANPDLPDATHRYLRRLLQFDQ